MAAELHRPAQSAERPERCRRTLAVRWLKLLAAAALIFMAGCSGCEDESAEPTNNQTGTQCTVDADCGATQVCREALCVEICATDADCADEQICTAGRYCWDAPGSGACETNDDCLSEVCDDGLCKPPIRCDADSDCFTGEVCNLEGTCVPACTVNIDCAAGEVCHDGRCVVGGSCTEDAECGQGGICQDGSCSVACSSDSECGQDAVCFEGNCSSGCTSNEECGANGICWRNVCTPQSDVDPTLPAPSPENPDYGTPGVDAGTDAGGVDSGGDTGGGTTNPDPTEAPECTVDTDCGSAERCETGRCVTDEFCRSDAECSPGSYCDRGQCRLGCIDSTQCRAGETCGADGRCEAQDGGGDSLACQSSSDCEPCELCISGSCQIVDKICVTDAQCGLEKSCLEGFCHYDCSSDSDCPYSQTCQSGVCKTDPSPQTPCTTSSECSSGETCIDGFCYGSCTADADCGSQMMCDHGVCRPDYRAGFECRSNSDCSAQSTCVNGYCTVECWDGSDCRTGTCATGGYCTR